MIKQPIYDMTTLNVKDVFDAIDTFNVDALVDFMTDDAVFRFGNVLPVTGKDKIRPFLKAFFQSIKAIRHDQIESWDVGGVILMNGRVTYTRHNGSQLRVFFSNTFKMKNDKIQAYYIFVDTSELYSQ